jgi:hypothetical protein
MTDMGKHWDIFDDTGTAYVTFGRVSATGTLEEITTLVTERDLSDYAAKGWTPMFGFPCLN